MEPIFHIARSSDWRAAEREGAYRVSTRDATLDDIGFIHCSFGHQVTRVARLVYGDDDDVVLLTIDPDRVPAEIRHENLEGGTEAFPHIYGPLPVSAVVEIGPMTQGDHERACDRFAAEALRYADVVTGADLDRRVPTCPDWSLAELTRHVGAVHRWAGQMVRDVAQQRLSFRHVEMDLDEGAPPDGDWIRAGVDRVVPWLRAADPDAEMWAWGLDQHARFWPRRMLHETTVHRADAEFALEREPDIAPEVAVDGIDEFLDNLPGAAYFAPSVTELKGDGTLAWHATDTGDRWRIRLEAERFSWARDPAAEDGWAGVTVSGSAPDLLLMVYGRRKPADGDRFAVKGNAGLLGWWLDRASV